jgi:hypothetical protein
MHWRLLHQVTNANDSSKKVLGRIKAVMKEPVNREDLDLYRLYASQLEKFDKSSEAQSVYSAALAFVSSTSEPGPTNAEYLSKNASKLNLAFACFKNLLQRLPEKRNECVQLLVDISGGCRSFEDNNVTSEPLSDARVLKSINSFVNAQSELLSNDFGVANDVDAFFVPSVSTSADVFYVWSAAYAWFLRLTSPNKDNRSQLADTNLCFLRVVCSRAPTSRHNVIVWPPQ